jgi:tRNA(Met) cytidine acetyltransferase
LLDNPDVHIWLARAGDAVVAVLLAVAEGGFDQAMAGLVLRGSRRPRGHLLPQSLAVHAGLDQALQQRVLRVQRIAVHPQLQRRGIGRSLLQRAADWAREHRFDTLGCAYGVEPALLAFWRSTGFRTARAGVRVDPASAAHSLFIVVGLSGPGRELADAAVRDFQAQLPWALAASLSDLDSHLAVQLLAGRDCSDLALSGDDWGDLERIAQGARQAATAEALVWRALVVSAADGRVAPERLAAQIARHLQHRAVEQVCRTFSMTGRRALERHLQRLLLDYVRSR